LVDKNQHKERYYVSMHILQGEYCSQTVKICIFSGCEDPIFSLKSLDLKIYCHLLIDMHTIQTKRSNYLPKSCSGYSGEDVKIACE
jgi:hypothetical protein